MTAYAPVWVALWLLPVVIWANLAGKLGPARWRRIINQVATVGMVVAIACVVLACLLVLTTPPAPATVR